MYLHWLIVFLVSLAVTTTDINTPVTTTDTETSFLPDDPTSSTNFPGRMSDPEDCSRTEKAEEKKRLFEYLSLENNETQNTRMWPLVFHDNPDDFKYFNPVTVFVDLYVTSIINVNEKAQSLTTQVKMITAWSNSNMTWEPDHYCGIKSFAAPRNMVWSPDIGVKESIKTEFGTKESPNVLLFNLGYTISSEVLALTTACKMDLYMFPFDTQTCSITLQSTAYSNQEIVIDTFENSKFKTLKSKELFQSQGEWDLITIDNSTGTTTDDIEWLELDHLIYKITIKRRPLLYVLNIIIPVLFFLVLDVISFFIDTNVSDKVSFKVTLLLSVSVMLLILNNTLPSTGKDIPLIGVFCCAVFCLIGISIVETILVNCLMVKGAKRSLTAAAIISQCGSVRDQQNPPDSVKDQNEEQSYTLNPLNQICTEVQAASQRKQLSWTRVARITDVTFLVLYILTVIVLMSVLLKHWHYP